MKLFKSMIAAVAAMSLLVSCEKDVDIDLFDSPMVEEGVGSLVNTDHTISSLAFKWNAVEVTYQYGYKLVGADNQIVRQGITKGTSAAFENLESNTEYTFTVEAYGQNGAPTKAFKLAVRTNAIIKLASPDISKMVITFDATSATVTWPEVEGAEYYDCVLKSALGVQLVSDRVEKAEIALSKMPIGDYVLIVTADSDSEAYTRSEDAVFEFTRPRAVVNEYVGTYESHALGKRDCTLKVYDDGAYVIEAFYGVEGFNLEFSMTRSGVITILNHYNADGIYRYVETGLDGDNKCVVIHQDATHCKYSSTTSGKQVKLYMSLGESGAPDYDTFTWK